MDELQQLRRLHEIATERTVQLSAVIERAQGYAKLNAVAEHAAASAHEGYWLDMLAIIERADTDADLREVRAKAWDEGYDVGYDDCRDGGMGITNPYREGK